MNKSDSILTTKKSSDALQRSHNTAFDYPTTAIKKTFVVLSSPRSGSTMLGSTLRQSELAGVPEEYFNPNVLKAAGVQNDLQGTLAYFEDVKKRRTTPNGTFGMKLHFNQFASVFVRGDHISEAGVAFLKSFDRFILTHRDDKILQAISYFNARKSNSWNSRDKEKIGSVNSSITQLDVPILTGLMQQLIHEEYSWRGLAAQLQLPCLAVRYEDLCLNERVWVEKVFQHLGLPFKTDQPLARTVKLSNETSLAAKQFYLRAIGAVT